MAEEDVVHPGDVTVLVVDDDVVVTGVSCADSGNQSNNVAP